LLARDTHAGYGSRDDGQNNWRMSGVAILATLSAVVTAVFVLGLFLWAARKDGEYDRATQRRLGIRRRTRL
jgi:hypothetical protein